MKPVVFIDFAGTLCYDTFWKSLDPGFLERIQGLLFQSDTSIIVDWMKGRLSSEEVNQFIASHLGLEYEALWAVFISDCESMQVSQKTLEHINALRSRFTTVLMTDNMDCFTRFTVPALRLGSYFDHISNSSDTGVLKSEDDGRAFLDIASNYGADITQSVIIDDSETACSTFEALGGRAYRATPERNVDHYLAKLK